MSSCCADAIQQLGAFYQKNGARKRMTSETGQELLSHLKAAEGALPLKPEK